MYRISLRSCEEYDVGQVKETLRQSVEDLGGFKPYLVPGEKVLLKVNLILAKEPSVAATTHPAFVQALVELLTEYGVSVLIGDSPGGLFNEETLRRNYRVTGMQDVAEKTGASLNYNTGAREIRNPDGKILKQITQTDMLSGVDKVISVSKLKTHSMMTFTGAVKNLFGTVPGTKKAEYHFSMTSPETFADALIDICLAAKPVLSFMDGIVAMEGNGPSGGTPRKIGAVLASASPFALDAVAASLIGLSVPQVPTLKQAGKRGLGPASAEEVEIVGESPEAFRVSDFRMPDHIEPNLARNYGRLFESFSKKLRPKVHFDTEKCIRCGQCMHNCPAKAISMEKGFPKADYRTCIRCYCCQELCPKNAITIRESRIMKIVNRL